MNDRNTQFWKLYQQYRFEDQQKWYEARQAEFEKARDQANTLNVVLLALAAVAGVLAAANILGLREWWSVLGVIFPALSTAISGYDGLYSFERQARLYEDAANALHYTRADAPDLKPQMGSADYPLALNSYILQVENIFRREQGQWGQLISEIKLHDPPAAPVVTGNRQPGTQG